MGGIVTPGTLAAQAQDRTGKLELAKTLHPSVWEIGRLCYPSPLLSPVDFWNSGRGAPRSSLHFSHEVKMMGPAPSSSGPCPVDFLVGFPVDFEVGSM